MADPLSSVPEERNASFTAPSPPSNSYRESIQSVAGPECRIRSALFPQSGQSGSSYSGDSGGSHSYPSNCSSSSFDLASAGVVDPDADKLTKIAHQMVSDKYIQRMVQAFEYSGCHADRVMETWFVELDVVSVLKIRQEELQEMSTASLQALVGRWIRAFTIAAASITEVVDVVSWTTAVARFGKASVVRMLVFVDTIVPALKVDKLCAVLDMYICVSNASYKFTRFVICQEAASIFKEICALLSRDVNRLADAICKAMQEAKTLMEEDNSWAIDIPREGGDVHRNTRLMVDCIVSLRKAQALAKYSPPWHKTTNFGNLLVDTVDYLKGLLLTKSELCLDPSLRYLFLLNNSYFVAQEVSEPSVSSGHHQGLELTPECEQYMDSYLDVSWGHVLSSMPKSNLHGPIRRWINTSALAKFQSAFHKTYKAQRFWKISDPRLRSSLREIIIERVISGYRDYLKEHPELEKQVSGGSSNPEVLEQMLRELFEG